MVEEQFGIRFFSNGHEILGHTSDPDDLKYIHDVRVELRKIVCTRTGRALAASLRYQLSPNGSQPEGKRGNRITVTPYSFDDCAAQEDGETRGSEKSWVMFTPAHRGSACFNKKIANLPHEKLFHELVHALRRVSGHLHKYPMGTRYTGYSNSEEFLAVVVTNIFISDLTNPYKRKMRQDYMTRNPLEGELADSYGFFKLGMKVFNILSTFCDENRGFTQMLAHVSASFNPIAALYNNRRKALEIAAGGDSDYVFDNFVNLDYYQAAGSPAWRRITPYPAPPAVRR